MIVDRRGVLTVPGRQLLVDRVEIDGWKPADAAKAMGVSRQTVYKMVATVPRRGSGRPCRPLLGAQALPTSSGPRRGGRNRGNPTRDPSWAPACGLSTASPAFDHLRSSGPSGGLPAQHHRSPNPHQALYRPQTNGRRSVSTERCSRSSSTKPPSPPKNSDSGLSNPGWPPYNAQRPHTAIGGLTCLQRLRQQRCGKPSPPAIHRERDSPERG